MRSAYAPSAAGPGNSQKYSNKSHYRTLFDRFFAARKISKGGKIKQTGMLFAEEYFLLSD
jgi:hypothetical protein